MAQIIKRIDSKFEVSLTASSPDKNIRYERINSRPSNLKKVLSISIYKR